MMRHSSIPLATIFLVALMSVTRSDASESTTHRVTSGTFGIAWIASEGLIYTYSLEAKAAPFRVNHLRAHQLAAIDYDADGRDELVIIDALKKSLFIYDFDDGKMIGGYGHNVSEITVGRFLPDEESESVIACTYTGDTYLWNRDVGAQGWIPIPGDFEKAYRGRVVSRINADSLVTVSRGDVYTLNPAWKTYSQVLLGKQAKLAISCDLSAFPGEEIVAACGDAGDLFICQRKMAEPLGQRAIAMSRGKLGTDKETVFAVTPAGTIARFDPKDKTWQDLSAEQAWADAIPHDIDGDGLEELFAMQAKSPEELFRYDQENQAFLRVSHRLLDVCGQQSAIQPENHHRILANGESENVALAIEAKPICDCKFWNTTHKPYIIRMYTPSGRNVLRDSPADHIHHHGLMFAITANDCDFWAEFPDKPQGKQELTELSLNGEPFDRQPSSAIARLLWKNADGLAVLQEERTMKVIPYDETTLLTWTSELSKAPGEKVTLAGSHYFGLGMRFVESMDNGGTFRFAQDQEPSTAVRGDERVTRASWAAYTATLADGEPATAVIFSHPDNFRPMYAFTMGDNSAAFAFLSATLNLYREPYEWDTDSKLRLRWGIALLDGNPSEESIEAAYDYWISTVR